MNVSQLQVSVEVDISAFEDAVNYMIGAMDNVADSVQSMADSFIEASSHVTDSGDNMLITVAKIGGGFITTMVTCGSLIKTIGTLSGTTSALSKILETTPIGLIITLIAGLITIAVECYYKFDTFRAIVNAVWAVIKDLAVIIGDALIGEFKILYDIVTWCIELFKDLGNIVLVFAVAPIKLLIDAIQALYYATIGADWGKAWDSIKQFGSDAIKSADMIKDSVLGIGSSTKAMAQNVAKDFTDSAKKIGEVASNMVGDVSKAYKDAFEKTKKVGEVEAKADKLTLTPEKIKINASSSNVETSSDQLGSKPGTEALASAEGEQSVPLPQPSGLIDGIVKAVPGIQASTEAVAGYNEQVKETAELQKEAQDAAVSAFSAIGQALGEMVAGQKKINPLAALMKQMGDSLKKYGDFLITAGTAMLFGGDPYGAAKVGEGIALEAVGTAMGAVKMASGGIVSGSTFANIGEYAGARNNPEVVAPLDKLQKMMGGNGGGYPSQIQLSARFDGLNAVLTRGNNNNGFINGFGS